MRRKVYFFLNNNEKNKEEAKRETFGFKSQCQPGKLRKLDNFGKNLLNVKSRYSRKNEIRYL